MKSAAAQNETGKRLVVCADDFGFTDAGCNSAIELAAAGAISAVSCVVDGRSLTRYADALRHASSSVSLGLHLNLTEPESDPLRANLRSWLFRAYVSRSIDEPALHAEIRRQLLRFEDLFTRAPAFVDGHEHVHQLPGIARILVEDLEDRYGTLVAVRTTVPRRKQGIKAHVIAHLGGTRLRDLLQSRRLPSNSDFAGAYDFSTRVAYGRRMDAWVSSIADGGLIMCHPEHPGPTDTPLTARGAEHAFLASCEWPALLRQHGARLVPFGPTAIAVPRNGQMSESVA